MKCRFNDEFFFSIVVFLLFFLSCTGFTKKKDTLCGTCTRDVDGVVGMMRIFLELLRHVDVITVMFCGMFCAIKFVLV